MENVMHKMQNPILYRLRSDDIEGVKQLKVRYARELKQDLIKFVKRPVSKNTVYMILLRKYGSRSYLQLMNESIEELWQHTVLEANVLGGIKKDDELDRFLVFTLLNIFIRRCYIKLEVTIPVDPALVDYLTHRAKPKPFPTGTLMILTSLIIVLYLHQPLYQFYSATLVKARAFGQFFFKPDLNKAASDELLKAALAETIPPMEQPTAAEHMIEIELGKWYGGGIYIDGNGTINPLLRSILKQDTVMTLIKFNRINGQLVRSVWKMRLFAEPEKHNGVDLQILN